MRIRWENIIPALVLILLVVIIVRSRLLAFACRSLEVLLWHIEDDPLLGVLSLGIICLTILGVFKFISNLRR